MSTWMPSPFREELEGDRGVRELEGRHLRLGERVQLVDNKDLARVGSGQLNSAGFVR